MQPESNLQLEATRLFQAYETKKLGDIANNNTVIAALVEEMDDLNKFLAMLAKATETEGDHVAEFESVENIELIRRLAANPQLHHLFPPGKFSWIDEEIRDASTQLQEKISEWKDNDKLKTLVEKRIEGFLQRQIHLKSEDTMLTQELLTKALEVSNRSLQQSQNFITTIQRNIQRVH